MAINDGGVKSVEAFKVWSGIVVRVWDGETRESAPETFEIPDNGIDPVPTQVEFFLMGKDMGPTWSWSVNPNRNPPHYDGQFAHYKNWKYSDRYAWKTR